MTDRMHARPASSGPVIGDTQIRADKRIAASDDAKAPIPWDMEVPHEPTFTADAARKAVESLADVWNEDAAVTGTPTSTDNEPRRAAAPTAPSRTTPSARARVPMLLTAAAAVALPLALIAVVAVPRLSGFVSAPAPSGQISILSDQPAFVSIDGKDRGATPVDVALDPGPHAVRVSSGQNIQAMTIVATAGAHDVHHVHVMGSVPAAPFTGTLRVSTPEPGARVALDGEFRGLTPMLFAALKPGFHSVVVSRGALSLRRDVVIDAERTIELDLVPAATSTAGSPAAGRVEISSPFDVEIWETGTLIGSSRTARLMLEPGTHTLDLVNAALLYRARRSVVVSAGRTTALKIAAPQGALSVNATPWADVWVDGSRVGETPLGEVSVPIGPHDIVLRHPDLAERHVRSIVRVGEVTRVAIDLRKGTPP